MQTNAGVKDVEKLRVEGLFLALRFTFEAFETSSCQQRHPLQVHVSLQLAKDVKPLELVQKLDNDLLRSMSLNYLAKVNITAVDQVNNKTWRPAQVTSMTTTTFNLLCNQPVRSY